MVQFKYEKLKIEIPLYIICLSFDRASKTATKAPLFEMSFLDSAFNDEFDKDGFKRLNEMGNLKICRLSKVYPFFRKSRPSEKSENFFLKTHSKKIKTYIFLISASRSI